MKRWLAIAGVVVLLAVVIAVSVTSGGPKGEKVYAEPAATKTIESVVTAPGQIDPKVKVNISAHIIGKIEKLYFNEGDTVKRGQKLVELEKPNYIAQRDRLLAEVARSRVEVQRARVGLATARAQYQRAQSLNQQGIQAQELFEQSRLAMENARAAAAAADQGVFHAEAALRQATEDLTRTTIVAPLDGKVVQLNAREGEVVVSGTMNNAGSVIAVIADLSQILVEAEVGETEVDSIRLGQPVKIKVDAITDREYHGKVVEIGSSASVRQSAGSGVRYFKVKVGIEDSDERLRPGMTSQVSIVTSSARNAVAVPIQCVVERVPGANADDEEAGKDDAPKKKYVFLADGAKAKQVEVRTGISDATHVTLLSGLKAGDKVITGPFRILRKLKDGMDIQVTKEVKTTSKKDDDKDKD
jgi:HlyD family secretion protein